MPTFPLYLFTLEGRSNYWLSHDTDPRQYVNDSIVKSWVKDPYAIFSYRKDLSSPQLVDSLMRVTDSDTVNRRKRVDDLSKILESHEYICPYGSTDSPFSMVKTMVSDESYLNN